MRLRALLAMGVLGSAALPASAGGAAPTVGTTFDNRFQPSTLTIDNGTTVNFHSDGGGPHNVKFADGGLEWPSDPSFLPWSTQRTFTAPGQFSFYCEQHRAEGMVGTIVVRGAPDGSQPGGGGGTTGRSKDTVAPRVSGLALRRGRHRHLYLVVRTTEKSTATVALYFRRGRGRFRHVHRPFTFGLRAGRTKLDLGRVRRRGIYRARIRVEDAHGNHGRTRKADLRVGRNRARRAGD
jgi:plastocyanin